MMYSLIVYQPLTNPYMRLVRVGDGSVVVAATGVVSKTTAWADSVITLAKNAIIGGIPVTIPANMPAGDYDMLFYDAAEPADTDAVQIGRRIAWTGLLLSGLPVNV